MSCASPISAPLRRFEHGSNEPRLIESFSLLLLALQPEHLESFAILLTLPSHLIPKASLARCTYKHHPPVLKPLPTATGPSNLFAKPSIKRTCWLCCKLRSSGPRNTASKPRLCLLHSPRALPRQRRGTRQPTGDPMAETLAAGTGT